MSVECKHEGCGRTFLDVATMADHADSVHTYDEIRAAVSKEVRTRFAREGALGVPSVYAWAVDLTDTWVVFEVEGANKTTLWQSDYTIDESGTVVLAEPVPVIRKTVYVPVAKGS